jgi:cell division protein FtsI (penicillin-binding protein 3)
VADKPADVWRETLKRRLTVACCVLGVWAAGIQARLVHLQVFQHTTLMARADRQQSRKVEPPAKRGEILDRHGRILARSVDADTIYAVPSEIGDPDQAAATLCGALQDCDAASRRAIAERIRRGKYFAYVRRQVSPEQAKRVAALELEGVDFIKENRRYYPNRDLAAHVLGYVGIDNVGLGGIEGTYDALIKGKSGIVLVQTDAHRRAFSRVERPPTAGASLELTIDQTIQHIVERELRSGVVASGASAGSAVVMDPHTGEILALASYPTFNPNVYRDAKPTALRNRAVQDYYEPGSTFKIVTASAALEERAVTPDTPIDASPGTIRFGSRVIRDNHDFGVVSFGEAIVNSSNVGAIKVALKLGPETVGAYVKRFGFGRPASPDFRGESAGMVWDPSSLDASALASVAMGYQVGVTPLQMAVAVSAVANGGQRVQPRVVRAVVRDGRRQAVPHTIAERAISPVTAAAVTDIMEQVVERGTGTRANVPGYTVAGKTGTAAKLVNGSYRGHSDYNVSFVGFVPSRQPVFAIVVVVDTPRRMSPYGGIVAAPIFQRIAAASLGLYGIAPSVNPPRPVFASRADLGGEPAPGSAASPSIVTVARGVSTSRSTSGVPDLTGMGAREAVRVLSELGYSVRIHGTGKVVEQSPEAGTPVGATPTATLLLDRRERDEAAPDAS